MINKTRTLLMAIAFLAAFTSTALNGGGAGPVPYCYPGTAGCPNSFQLLSLIADGVGPVPLCYPPTGKCPNVTSVQIMDGPGPVPYCFPGTPGCPNNLQSVSLLSQRKAVPILPYIAFRG